MYLALKEVGGANVAMATYLIFIIEFFRNICSFDSTVDPLYNDTLYNSL